MYLRRNSIASLIVGAGGQDGSILRSKLQQSGVKVFRMLKEGVFLEEQNLLRSDELKRDNLTRIIQENNIKKIFFTASQSYPKQRRLEIDSRDLKQTFERVENTLHACLQSINTLDFGIQFIFFSSSLRFGKLEGEINENTPTDPIEIYGSHKLNCENLILEESKKCTNILPLILILFNHTSKKSKPGYLFSNILEAVKKMNLRWLQQELSKALESQDFIDIGFSVQYMELVILLSELDFDQKYIISTGNSLPISYFFETAISYLKSKNIYEFEGTYNHKFHANNKQFLDKIKMNRNEMYYGQFLMKRLLENSE
jgi:GDP-D-mannose dehydratase